MAKRGRPKHPDVLTPREWEVLALLRDGRSNDEIAQRLDISLAGAKYHVSEILGKLGVASREEAAAWQPRERPWWAAVATPLGALRRAASASRLSVVGAAVAATVIGAGLGLLVWGLVRTGGGGGAGEDSPAVGAASPPMQAPSEPTTPLVLGSGILGAQTGRQMVARWPSSSTVSYIARTRRCSRLARSWSPPANSTARAVRLGGRQMDRGWRSSRGIGVAAPLWTTRASRSGS